MSEDLIRIVTMRHIVGERSGNSVLLGPAGMASSVLLALFCNYINRERSDRKNVFHCKFSHEYFSSRSSFYITRNETQIT